MLITLPKTSSVVETVCELAGGAPYYGICVAARGAPEKRETIGQVPREGHPWVVFPFA